MPTILARQPGQVVDFRPIANEEINLFRIGDDLQILFADGGYILIEGFFVAGDPAKPEAVVLADDVAVTLAQLGQLLDIRAFDEIQTAAGPDGTTGGSIAAALSPQNDGFTFVDPNFGSGGDLGDLMDLLGLIDPTSVERLFPETETTDDGVPGNDLPTTPAGGSAAATEDDLADGPVIATFANAPLNPGAEGYLGGSLNSAINFTTVPDGLRTSDGVAIIVTVAGATVTGARADTGATVFTLEVSSGGDHVFTLNEALFHAGAGADVLDLDLGFTITDLSGDVSGVALLTVNITDDIPVIDGDLTDAAGGISENSAADATLQNAITGTVAFFDFGSGDFPTAAASTATSDVLLAYTAPGETVPSALPAGLDADAIRTAFSVATDGVWTYDASGLDLEVLPKDATIELTYTVVVTDNDGDTAEQQVLITVTGTNDDPTLSAAATDAFEDGKTVDVDLAALGDDVDSDDDGTSLTYTVETGPAEGSASIAGTTLSFDPGKDFQDLAE
ncbi:MAG: VCBS domain-containing protein, partial [Hyphomicrobiales bacterium]|nr:VCBS domain-containing protein [Hyphomicrobiales bacterium]